MANIKNRVFITTGFGLCEFVTFANLSDQKEHFAIIFKNVDKQNDPLIRVHSECITGDLFQSSMCDCGDQLSESLKSFANSGGILVYLRQEGRGIGLYNKLETYILQQKGYDTFQANGMMNFPEDMRSFSVAGEMLQAMNISQVRLLTNNLNKYKELEESGIHVKERISTGFYLKEENKNYLKAKIKKAGHQFSNQINNLYETNI